MGVCLLFQKNKSGYVIALGNLRSLLKQHSSPAPIFSQDQLVEKLPPGNSKFEGGKGGRKIVPKRTRSLLMHLKILWIFLVVFFFFFFEN